MDDKYYLMGRVDHEEIELINYKYFFSLIDQSARSQAALQYIIKESLADHKVFLDFEEQKDSITDSDYIRLLNSEHSTIVSGPERRIWSSLNKLCLEKKDAIAVDITACSIPELFRTLYYLKKVACIERVDVFYTEPQNYIYEDVYFETFNSSGSKEPIQYSPIIGYMSSGKRESEVLVLIIGFDAGLGQQVSFQTDREEDEGLLLNYTFIINGLPSYSIKLKDISLLNNFELINNLGRKQVIGASANSPYSTYNVLLELHEKCAEDLLTICPICSKPMALGACMYALDNEDNVKVTYPFGSEHRDLSNEKVGSIWRYTI